MLLDVEGTMIKSKTLLAFQHDLQQGMTINEACRKHDITFKYACDNMGKIQKKKIKPRKSSPTHASEYIQERNGKYFLRKYVSTCKRKKSSTVMFGTYHTLEDAIRMREHCKKHGWNQRSVDDYCKELGIERVISSKTKARYH